MCSLGGGHFEWRIIASAGVPTRVGHCFMEIERHFHTRPAPVVFRTILLPTLLANLGWNLPIHLCGWNSDTISLVEPQVHLLFLLTNRARGLRGDQSSPWGMELLFPAEIRNRSNTFIFVPNLSLCIWYVWPSAVAAKNVCQRYHGYRP